MTIAEGLAAMQLGGMGRALFAATTDTTIVVTEATSFADYSNLTVRVNPKVLAGGYSVPGVLAHELGHAHMHKSGMLTELRKLPFNLGTIGNELVSEGIASAIAQESGFERGGSAVTRKDGTLRSMRGALDEILATDFYVKYYKIDLTKMTEELRVDVAAKLLAVTAQAITALGGTVPVEYATPGPR